MAHTLTPANENTTQHYLNGDFVDTPSNSGDTLMAPSYGAWVLFRAILWKGDRLQFEMGPWLICVFAHKRPWKTSIADSHTDTYTNANMNTKVMIITETNKQKSGNFCYKICIYIRDDLLVVQYGFTRNTNSVIMVRGISWHTLIITHLTQYISNLQCNSRTRIPWVGGLYPSTDFSIP